MILFGTSQNTGKNPPCSVASVETYLPYFHPSAVAFTSSGYRTPRTVWHVSTGEMRLLHYSAKSAPIFVAEPGVTTIEDTPSPLRASQRMAKHVTHTLVVSRVSSLSKISHHNCVTAECALNQLMRGGVTWPIKVPLDYPARGVRRFFYIPMLLTFICQCEGRLSSQSTASFAAKHHADFHRSHRMWFCWFCFSWAPCTPPTSQSWMWCWVAIQVLQCALQMLVLRHFLWLRSLSSSWARIPATLPPRWQPTCRAKYSADGKVSAAFQQRQN